MYEYEDQFNETTAVEETPEDRAKARRKKRWERRRNWDKTRISVFSILLLGGAFALITLFLLVFPRPTISEIENRELERLPKFSFQSYFSGEFTEKLAIHYVDTVPYRDYFKNVGNQFKSLFGVRSAESAVTFINKPLVENAMGAAPKEEDPSATLDPADPSTTDPSTATTVPEEPIEEEAPPQKNFREEEAEFNMSNGLLVVQQDGHWKCLGLFGGGSGDAYAEALNTLQEQVSSRVKIYSMPAPLASQFYLPSNASDYSRDQSECFDAVHEKLDDRIITINICDEMAKHTEEEIYCRTDHHWQALGAYYACEQFAKTAGVPFADLSEYEKGVNEGYVGTMYAFSEDSRILNDPEDFTYYVPTCEYEAHFYDSSFNYEYTDDLFREVGVASSYLMFLGSDEYIVKVDTEVNNNRRLLVIKDSYGNAEIPFYTSSFEQVFVADMRYLERNLPNFIEAMGITDVLFSMCSYSVVGGNADNLMNLITQDAGSEIIDEQPAIAAEKAAEEAEAARQAALEQPDPNAATEETASQE
ncbi:MAG: hypothetical protein E7464_06295 [Ruminococcaceae bacterium]|nr:hypothetical protein [Oscillospiraceae bacterium]